MNATTELRTDIHKMKTEIKSLVNDFVKKHGYCNLNIDCDISGNMMNGNEWKANNIRIDIEATIK